MTGGGALALEAGLRRVAENRIETAIREGWLENLPGAGKPLPPDPFHSVDPAHRLAHRALNAAGFAPLWIELEREVRAARDSSIRQLRQAAARTQGSGPLWLRAVERFRSQVRELNAWWARRNHLAPAAWSRPGLDFEAEIQTALALLLSERARK